MVVPDKAKGMGRFGKIERRFAVDLITHFSGMSPHSYRPNAKDAPHRECLVAADDRSGGNSKCRKDVIS